VHQPFTATGLSATPARLHHPTITAIRASDFVPTAATAITKQSQPGLVTSRIYGNKISASFCCSVSGSTTLTVPMRIGGITVNQKTPV